MLLEPRTEARALFRPAAIQRLCREHRSGSKDNSDRLWLLLNLELWHRIFIDQDSEYAARQVAGMGEKRLNYATTST
jgi:asparagine synthase (glutamine-hydrolysing)